VCDACARTVLFDPQTRTYRHAVTSPCTGIDDVVLGVKASTTCRNAEMNTRAVRSWFHHAVVHFALSVLASTY